ncbi:putative gustatory receptor 98a [Drosophila serrata]|uniref:putative gustatory receptor 98a n=1 Tax=Drosophila serrata TaxID=7274 RepID=UPI000A1D37AD|nr:putative gustatory receptor 98a [Drosophila serrata]
MGPVSGELHAVSMLGMDRVMKCMVMLPVSEHLIAKVFCNAILVCTVVFSTRWRLRFDYEINYDVRNDQFSRFIDMTNYVAMIVSHIIIVMELVWLKRNDEVNNQLEGIRREMNVLLGIEVNLQRVRGYCNAVYASLFIRCLVFGLATIIANRPLTYYAIYSEIVLLVRFSQFSLFCAVILALYQELTPAGLSVLAELESSLYELDSVRQSSIENLAKLQRLHGLLWQAIRCLEHNFQICLITMLMKFFVDTSAMPYWLYLSNVQITGWRSNCC